MELDKKQRELGTLEGQGAEATKNAGEFTRTKARVGYVEAELSKFQELTNELDERVEVNRSLEHISGILTELGKEADRLAVASEPRPVEAELGKPQMPTKVLDERVKVNRSLRHISCTLTELDVEADRPAVASGPWPADLSPPERVLLSCSASSSSSPVSMRSDAIAYLRR
jgi:hypothetical protein